VETSRPEHLTAEFQRPGGSKLAGVLRARLGEPLPPIRVQMRDDSEKAVALSAFNGGGAAKASLAVRFMQLADGDGPGGGSAAGADGDGEKVLQGGWVGSDAAAAVRELWGRRGPPAAQGRGGGAAGGARGRLPEPRVQLNPDQKGFTIEQLMWVGGSCGRPCAVFAATCRRRRRGLVAQPFSLPRAAQAPQMRSPARARRLMLAHPCSNRIALHALVLTPAPGGPRPLLAAPPVARRRVPDQLLSRPDAAGLGQVDAAIELALLLRGGPDNVVETRHPLLLRLCAGRPARIWGDAFFGATEARAHAVVPGEWLQDFRAQLEDAGGNTCLEVRWGAQPLAAVGAGLPQARMLAAPRFRMGDCWARCISFLAAAGFRVMRALPRRACV
jgi:hypothetical protein